MTKMGEINMMLRRALEAIEYVEAEMARERQPMAPEDRERLDRIADICSAARVDARREARKAWRHDDTMTLCEVASALGEVELALVPVAADEWNGIRRARIAKRIKRTREAIEGAGAEVCEDAARQMNAALEAK